jgi:hypothetical protein
VAAILVAARHLPETHAERWPARRVVIALTGTAAILGYYQAWKSGGLAEAIVILNDTTKAYRMQISQLREGLSAAEQSEGLLRRELIADKASLADLRSRLAVSERERTSEDAALEAAAKAASRSIAATLAQTSLIGAQGRYAMKEANAASAESKRTAGIVAETDAETIRRSREALLLAQSAAAKARVFHFAVDVLRAGSSALAQESPGNAVISCVPGYETACTDLRSMFVTAQWPRPIIVLAASMYTGAGLDAPTDPSPDAGLIIFYRPARERLAQSLARILAQAGFTVGIHPLTFNPGNHEFEIAVRFLDQ